MIKIVRSVSTICLPVEDHKMYRVIAKAMYLPFSIFIQKAIEKAYKKAIYDYKERARIDKVWNEEKKVEEVKEDEKSRPEQRDNNNSEE